MTNSVGGTFSSKWKQSLHYFSRRARIMKRHNCVILAVFFVIIVFSVFGGDSIKQLYDISSGFGSDTIGEGYNGGSGFSNLLPDSSTANSNSGGQVSSELTSSNAVSNGVTISSDLKDFYQEIMTTLKETALKGKLEVKKPEGCKLSDTGVENTDSEKLSTLTKDNLLKCLPISDEDVKEVKEAHNNFKKLLQDKLMPNFKKLNTEKDPVYKGEGISIVGGGKYTLMALPVIKSIRMNSGLTLKSSVPIEIVIPPSDNADRKVCENIIPTIDPSGLTKCVYLSEFFDSEILKDITGYQLKSLSLLISSFEKVLLLDADNYVINSLGNFFDGDIFRETGLILWPDYWRRVHSPKLYDIVDIKVQDKLARYSTDYITNSRLFPESDPAKIPFHDLEGAIPDGSTESGQLLVNKASHLDALILSLYYNYNGPSYYYRLLGQGISGEGDKDTFILAATVLKHRYYQVRTPVRPQGYWGKIENEVRIQDDLVDDTPSNEKKYRGIAMIQHDYNEDKTFDSIARDAIRGSVNNKLKAHRLEYIKNHKSEFKDMNEKDALEKVSKMSEVSDKFWDSMKGKYTIKDFFTIFQFTTPVFLHSNLPKYNPWELSISGDLLYDGKKATKKMDDPSKYVPNGKGHHRMYSPTFKDLTNYDLELANWKLFDDVLCKNPDDYLNFSYLSEVIGATEKPEQEVKNMCKYIKDRVEYLKLSTWENSSS